MSEEIYFCFNEQLGSTQINKSNEFKNFEYHPNPSEFYPQLDFIANGSTSKIFVFSVFNGTQIVFTEFYSLEKGDNLYLYSDDNYSIAFSLPQSDLFFLSIGMLEVSESFAEDFGGTYYDCDQNELMEDSHVNLLKIDDEYLLVAHFSNKLYRVAESLINQTCSSLEKNCFMLHDRPSGAWSTENYFLYDENLSEFHIIESNFSELHLQHNFCSKNVFDNIGFEARIYNVNESNFNPEIALGDLESEVILNELNRAVMQNKIPL